MPYKKSINLTILSLILFSFIFSHFSYSQTTTSQYKGKIGNYPITIEVYKEGKDKIKGRYMYDKVGQWLKLEGKILKNNRVIIYEYDKNNKNTGRFIGKIEKGNVLKIEKHINNKTKKYLNVRLPKIVLGEEKIKDLAEKQIYRYKTWKGIQIIRSRISSDGKLTYVEFTKDDKYYIQVNGKIYGPVSQFFVSSDGSKYMFYFIDEKTHKYYVQVNNKRYGPYEVVYYPGFSLNGSKYGWGFKKDDKFYVQVNDKIYGPYDDETFPRFSEDGNIYWWFYTETDEIYLSPVYLQINENTYGPFGSVEYFKFSPDYSNYILVYSAKASLNDETLKYYVRINDKIYGPYDDLYNITEPFKSLKDKLVFGRNFVKSKKEYYVQVNDKIYGPYDLVEYGAPIFCGNGEKYGWWYSKDNKYYVLINDKEYGPYDRVGDIVFSKDCLKYGWGYEKNRKVYIQINEITYGPYDAISFYYKSTGHQPVPVFSNDGSMFGWSFIKDLKYYIQINEKTYGPYDVPVLIFPFIDLFPIFSEDNSKFMFWFYNLKENKYYAQINNETYGPYETIGLRSSFSKDGTKWGWIYGKSDSVYVQINNKSYGPYKSYVDFTFTPNNNIYILYLDKANNELVIEKVE